MPSPLTKYLFRVIWQTNLHVWFIVDTSPLLPVYISHMRGLRHLELSRAIPVIAQKVRVQEAVPYHLGDMIIVSQNRNGFVLFYLWHGVAPNAKERILFPRYLEGYHDAEGSIIHIWPVWVILYFCALRWPHWYDQQYREAIQYQVSTQGFKYRVKSGINQVGYEMFGHFFVCSRYPLEVGFPLGVLYQPRGVTNHFYINDPLAVDS